MTIKIKKSGLQDRMLKLGVSALALSSKFPNDADFGKAIRQSIRDLEFQSRNIYPGPTKL